MRDGYPEMPGRRKMVQSSGVRVIALSLSGLLVLNMAMSGVSGLPRPSASLTWNGTLWTLTDKAKMVYQFSATGRLTKITDAALRSILLTYNATDGKLARARVSNSQTNTAGRSLVFTWSGNHIASVATDPVGGTTPTWTYSYSGDLLASVCAPGNLCTQYTYAPGNHYGTGVLDARPESYWRLGEA
jgi:hypothetical protein